MVSIKTVLTLGAIGVAVALFFGAGGFKGTGTKIGSFFGGGISDFTSSISSAFTGGLFGGNAGAASVANAEGTNTGSTNQVKTTTSANQFLDLLNPIKSQLSIFQLAIDALKDVGNFGQQAFGAGPAFNDVQSRRDFNLIGITESALGRPINVQRSVAAQRELGNTPFAVVSGGRTRFFATQATASSFLERMSR